MTTAEGVLAALQPYHLRKEGQGKYRFNCPWRPGADSMSCTLVITSPEHGAFHDHHPSADPASGSLYDLARRLDVALPAAVPIENTKRAYAGGADYAQAHGLIWDDLRRWGYRETVVENRPALEFQTPTGLRYRFIDGAKSKAVYKSVPGYARCWYGLENDLRQMLLDGKPLVLCNGEISVIAGRKNGLATLALTGGEKAEIPAELFEQLRGFLADIPSVKMIIALDCDKPGRTAARGLEAQFYTAGFAVRAVDLELGVSGDLADFCRLYAPDVLATLQQRPDLPPALDNSRFTFATLDEVLHLAPIDWLVAKQIPARGLTMIFGASGTYKSFFILDKVLVLALDGVNVLYIAAEGEHGYRQRLEAWIRHHGKKPGHITFVLGQVDLFDPEELTEFSRLVAVHKPRIVVVDTFAMCSGMAEENSTRDMMIIVNGCKAMSKQLDAVIVVVHHTNAEGKRERGNKALRNACDTILRLSLEDDLICVQSQKTKDTQPFETYYLAPLTVPLGYRNNLGEDVTSVVLLPADKVIRGDDLTPLQRQVLETLAAEPSASLQIIADAVESDNRGSISKIINKLEKRGYVANTATGRQLSDKGRRALDGDSADSSAAAESRNAPPADVSQPVESPESAATWDQTFGDTKRGRSHYNADL